MPGTAADAALLASLAGRTVFKAVFVPSAYGVGSNLLMTFDDGRSLMVTPCAHAADCGIHIAVVGAQVHGKRPGGGSAP